MLLQCRFLNDVQGPNSFSYTPQVEIYTGDSQRMYIQLLDGSLDRGDQGFNPPGRRYMPTAPATMRVTLQNIDDAKVVYRAGVQAFPTIDPSIWYIPLLSSDPLTGTVTIAVQLIEPNGIVHNLLNQKGLLLRAR